MVGYEKLCFIWRRCHSRKFFYSRLWICATFNWPPVFNSTVPPRLIQPFSNPWVAKRLVQAESNFLPQYSLWFVHVGIKKILGFAIGTRVTMYVTFSKEECQIFFWSIMSWEVRFPLFFRPKPILNDILGNQWCFLPYT